MSLLKLWPPVQRSVTLPISTTSKEPASTLAPRELSSWLIWWLVRNVLGFAKLAQSWEIIAPHVQMPFGTTLNVWMNARVAFTLTLSTLAGNVTLRFLSAPSVHWLSLSMCTQWTTPFMPRSCFQELWTIFRQPSSDLLPSSEPRMDP